MPLGAFVFTFMVKEPPTMDVMGANTTIIVGFIVEIENGVGGSMIAYNVVMAGVIETTVMPIGGWEFMFDKGTIMPPGGEV